MAAMETTNGSREKSDWTDLNAPCVSTEVEKMDLDKADENVNWLKAHFDPVAGVYSFSSCIALADLNGDGDHKLVIADLGTGKYNMMIKVLKGTSVVQENTLLDLPTGVVSVYMDMTEPRTPGLVVASGSGLFVYKNMRPYYKYNVEALTVLPEEQQLWDQSKVGNVDVATLADALNSLKNEYSSSMLTSQTSHFLKLSSQEEAKQFVEDYKNVPLKRETVITCITTMKKSMAEDDAISCIVLGLENKEIHIVDCEAYTVLHKFTVHGVPVIINVSGLFDVDFRMFVACRNGCVYTLKKDSDNARVCLDLNSQVVGMERIHKCLVVAMMDRTFTSFTTKGRQLWSLEMPADILCTTIMDHKAKGFKAVMVGLSNNEVHIYRDKNLVDTVKLNDRPQALCFGRYGREDSTLVAVLASGALQVLILKRTAEYADHSLHRGPPSSQYMKLNIPKKTQLFVDQTVRERENGIEMFQNFQNDLQMMRVNVAEMYLKGLQSSMTPLSDDPNVPLKLSATVQGIGPMFQLILTIENTALPSPSDAKLLTDLKVVFKYLDKVYTVSPGVLSLPALVPDIPYKFSIQVECIASDQPAQDTITAFIVKPDNTKPVVTANISMPASEGVVVV
uniref:Bardet-Biedl syndrome 1 protein-like n=1 Tax=Phallusia mammillata TaxID=59560 RepID=A0A6F9D796_9ASCI|nr:Bardet-Biedl syndrome 1 protein-like [Phallusia mammillata]